jgi:UDP-2-acetamido-2,6-beta-L-arabino-hexul-4-ose reductase
MLKIGITGQSGFIGTHLYNTLGLYPDKFERIKFYDDFFQDGNKLNDFVCQCDTIVHLAALNRHNDPEVIYQTNISLVKQLIAACETTHSKPHILFSSSTQEEKDNYYGKSKKEGRILFEEWAARNLARFTGFVIPNVFGPFGNPYYNSVVATFCHQLTHNETPGIDIDGEIKLIYVGELVNKIIDHIELSNIESAAKGAIEFIKVPHIYKIKTSELLELLESYKNNYFEKGEMPPLDTLFRLNMFNTFLTYIDHSSFLPFKLKLNTDHRGSFVEIVKLNSGGQVSFSTTIPGFTRGNHFHTKKAERFAVVRGKARIELRRIGTDRILSFKLDGTHPSFVDMPVWYTHNITNIGEEELITIFWTNEHFNINDPDKRYRI